MIRLGGPYTKLPTRWRDFMALLAPSQDPVTEVAVKFITQPLSNMAFQVRDSSTESYDSFVTDASKSTFENMAQRFTPGQYPPFANRFQSLQHAENWLFLRDDRKGSGGAYRFDHYHTNFQRYAERVYRSIVNMEDLREYTSNSYKNFRDNKIDPRDIEATAVLIVHAWIKRHEHGPLNCFNKVPVADRDLGMEDRLDMICDTLHHCKLNCEDVLKKNKLEYIIHAPIQARRTKDQNKQINTQREPVLRAGNHALGRQPKRAIRPRTTQHGRIAKPSPSALPLRDYGLSKHPLANNVGTVDFDDYLNQESVTLPPIETPSLQVSHPSGGSDTSSTSRLRRSSRPASIATHLPNVVDPALRSPTNAAHLREFLEPDAQTSIELLTPTCGGMFTSRGINFNTSFDMPSHTGFTPMYASGTDPFPKGD